MKRILLFSFLIVSIASQAQISTQYLTLHVEGIYSNSREFVTDEMRQVGTLEKSGPESVVFSMRYKNTTYTPKNIWGYRDHEGNDYRAIDEYFYKIVSKSTIWVYVMLDEKENEHYMVSMGYNRHPVEASPENLGVLIAANKELSEQYAALSKKEKKTKAIEFVYSYNDSLDKQSAVLTGSVSPE